MTEEIQAVTIVVEITEETVISVAEKKRFSDRNGNNGQGRPNRDGNRPARPQGEGRPARQGDGNGRPMRGQGGRPQQGGQGRPGQGGNGRTG